MEGPSRYDLHLHTTCSDGTLSPTELTHLAKVQGLRAFALTDHDTLEGIAEAESAAEALGIHVVPGVEVSANHGEVAVHVLGLFVDYEQPWLERFFAEARQRRIDRIHAIVRKLAKVGVEVSPEAVFARSRHGTVGRPHVAEVLVATGAVKTMAEAFERFLADDGPAYVGYKKVTLEDACDLIRRAKGVASLAHPVHYDKDGLIPDMVSSGLQAIEVYHKDHSPAQIKQYAKLAADLGLLATGGSDFHRPDGAGSSVLGCPHITEERFEALREAAG
jgi:predicted metal-dependent phosphoesterase TrpH